MEKIVKANEDNFCLMGETNTFVKGVLLLNSLIEPVGFVDILAEHDIVKIWADDKKGLEVKLSEEQIIQMLKWGWYYGDDMWCYNT
jgi:hypothetical protein